MKGHPHGPEYRDLLDRLDTLMADLHQLNQPERPSRSRELSLAITKLQEGKHWLLAGWGPIAPEAPPPLT